MASPIAREKSLSQMILRQGDPLSPYLFIIVADVLQRLIHQARLNGTMRHPIDNSLRCPVLQYADDTLIFLQGEIEAVTALRRVFMDDPSLVAMAE